MHRRLSRQTPSVLSLPRFYRVRPDLAAHPHTSRSDLPDRLIEALECRGRRCDPLGNNHASTKANRRTQSPTLGALFPVLYIETNISRTTSCNAYDRVWWFPRVRTSFVPRGFSHYWLCDLPRHQLRRLVFEVDGPPNSCRSQP